MSTQQASGVQVTVHGHPNLDTLLLWHPAVRTDPDGVTALASRIANRSGVRVVVPVWSGGADLMRSVHFARKTSVHPPDALSVVGYAEAGIAALGLAQNQRRLGIGLSRVTCVDGAADLLDPISGRALTTVAGPAAGPAAGTAVDIVDSTDTAKSSWARASVDQWQAAGWAAELIPTAQFTWRVSPSQ